MQGHEEIDIGELVTRRDVLKAAGSLGLVLACNSVAANPLLASVAGRSRLTPEAVKARIRGPILTIPTPFTADFQVDYQGVRNMVNLGLANKVDVYELTAGNSQYNVLSYDEIKKLTKVLTESVAGRGIVIAATGAWWTGQAVDYARYAQSVGADAVQVLLPSGSDDLYVEHFNKIAAATRIGIALQGAPSFPLMERLVQIPAVVTMKEDGSEEYFVEVTKRFGRRLAIFCGGQKRRYLLGLPYGSPAYFSFFFSFFPRVGVQFWQAVKDNDLPAARDIVERYEKPVFAFCSAGPRGFHAYWRALMEHFGVAKRYVRPPEESCNEEDMRRVRALVERLDLVSEEEPTMRISWHRSCGLPLMLVIAGATGASFDRAQAGQNPLTIPNSRESSWMSEHEKHKQKALASNFDVVFLMGLFPRKHSTDPPDIPAHIREVNAQIARPDDNGRTVRYLDLCPRFLHPDGSLISDTMIDGLNLSPRGYEIWADGVIMPIAELMRSSASADAPREDEEALRRRAVEVMRAAMNTDPIKSMHAAEALTWNGYVADPIAHTQKLMPGANPPMLIGHWRVLAQALRNPQERKRYVNKVRDAAADPKSLYAEFSVESLAQLGYGGHDQRFVELARSGSEVMQILARWVLANSGAARDEAYLTELYSLKDSRMRGIVSYALRFLPKLRPGTLAKLRDVAKNEPAGGEGRIFHATTLYVHDPKADRKSLKEELFKFADTGTPEEKYQSLLTVGKWADRGDLARLEPMLSDADTDVRIASAHAILTILKRSPSSP